jgi:flagellar basal-body rod protein FlgG
VQQTGRDLDVAIFGRGYFVFTDPVMSRTLYTRCGRLSIDANGMLCVGRDRLLEPCITIPPEYTNLSIGTDGNVFYYVQGQTVASNAGQIQIATFVNPEGLQEILPGFFEETGGSGPPQIDIAGLSGAGPLQPGYLETPEGHRLEITTLLLVGLCALVGWLAWEVRCLRQSLAQRTAEPLVNL